MQLQLMPAQERTSVREAAPSSEPDPKVQPMAAVAVVRDRTATTFFMTFSVLVAFFYEM